MKTIAFIYARMDSSRLPGKALKPLAGRFLIDIVFDRVQNAPVESCVLLTTGRAVDDPLVEHVDKRGIQVIRGHATDLVARTIEGLSTVQPTRFLRVNGDSPFFETELATCALSSMRDAKIASNLFVRKFPYGVAIEIVDSDYYVENSANVLEHEREHVTMHLYRVAKSSLSLSLQQKRDDSWLSLAVDTPDDYRRLDAILEEGNLGHSYWEIFNLETPDLVLRRMQ